MESCLERGLEIIAGLKVNRRVACIDGKLSLFVGFESPAFESDPNSWSLT
jgi:hypothetical protein